MRASSASSMRAWCLTPNPNPNPNQNQNPNPNPNPSTSPSPNPNPNQVPLYGAVVSRMQRGSGHNYDDINEAFWAPRCLVWLGLGLG